MNVDPDAFAGCDEDGRAIQSRPILRHDQGVLSAAVDFRACVGDAYSLALGASAHLMVLLLVPLFLALLPLTPFLRAAKLAGGLRSGSVLRAPPPGDSRRYPLVPLLEYDRNRGKGRRAAARAGKKD